MTTFDFVISSDTLTVSFSRLFFCFCQMKTSVRPAIIIAIICVKILKAPSNVSVQKDLKWKVKTVLVSGSFGLFLCEK